MSGNTRGKLKENFEGVHRNLDWCMKHINNSLELIAIQLMQSQPDEYKKDDADEAEAALMTYPLYQAVKALGEGIDTLDGLANNIYATL
ncbi:unnamed protein product [marine sediment metagenome]|uniref:Uncharacterized protein n=1 Tax=marine sediment metagenome TaxID=412755 RepID=X1QR66_9ZZZZ